MSGPLPIAAAVAVLGRRSSQLSLVTVTCTPVASVNFLLFARNRVSSPCTNLDGRRTRNEAPDSSSNLGGARSLTATCARRLPLESIVVPARAPAPICSASRRVNKFMAYLPVPGPTWRPAQRRRASCLRGGVGATSRAAVRAAGSPASAFSPGAAARAGAARAGAARILPRGRAGLRVGRAVRRYRSAGRSVPIVAATREQGEDAESGQ